MLTTSISSQATFDKGQQGKSFNLSFGPLSRLTKQDLVLSVVVFSFLKQIHILKPFSFDGGQSLKYYLNKINFILLWFSMVGS